MTPLASWALLGLAAFVVALLVAGAYFDAREDIDA